VGGSVSFPLSIVLHVCYLLHIPTCGEGLEGVVVGAGNLLLPLAPLVLGSVNH